MREREREGERSVHREADDCLGRKDTPGNKSWKVSTTRKQENQVERNTLVISKVDPLVKHLDLW